MRLVGTFCDRFAERHPDAKQDLSVATEVQTANWTSS
jgi:hypothetical protein